MTTQFGPFELRDPFPALDRPRLLLSLRPWIDVGSVGTMTLAFLEESWGAQPVGQLARPGVFYDFTRYRPMLFRREGRREVSIPNTALHHARAGDRDWLLMHALEPHSHGDDYVDGLMDLIEHLGVSQYTLLGSMYAPVPHTRAPVASGGASSEALRARLHGAGVRESTYEGPTTVLAAMPGRATTAGIDTASLIIQLPAYAQLERDYRGLHAMLGLLAGLYGFSLKTEGIRGEAEKQSAALDESVREDARAQAWVTELETLYDAEQSSEARGEDLPRLSPELESFLKDVEQRLE